MALVEPGFQTGHFVVVLQRSGLIEQAERCEIVVPQACLLVASAQFCGQALQPCVIQTRDQDCALGVLEKAAALSGNRRALFGADAENQQALAAPLHQGADGAAFVLVQTAADQQQTPPAQPRLLEQGETLGDSEVCTLAGLGHQRRMQGIQQIASGCQVVGQWHHGVGAAGEYHDGGLYILSPLQQIQQFALGLLEARGWNVAGEHRGGQFQQHHQRIAALHAGLLEALPAGAEQCDDGQQPGKAKHQPGQATVAQPAAGQQGSMKGFREQALPAADLQLTMPEPPQQPDQQGQDDQPVGPQ